MTIDLVQVLRDIEEEARKTREGIAAGEVPKGSASLRRIEEQAQDGIRWAIVKEES